MAGPGNEITARAKGHSQLRASHVDREQVIELLKAAFVQGRLGKDEFELRVGQVLASRTYADLAVLTDDIPAGLTGAQRLVPARESSDNKAVRLRLPVPDETSPSLPSLGTTAVEPGLSS